jgi:succinate dehydrogenase/fumarate reductase cytochrome b subunit
MAAYFGIDVTLVRLAFVAAAFLTGGAAFLAYLVLMFVVPYAQTSEEHAAAHGLPFNARALVERAKEQAAQFASSSEWRRSRAAWRASWRRSRAERRAARAAAPTPPPSPPPSQAAPSRPPYAAHILTGIVLAVLGVFLAVFTFVWVVALVSLVTTGAILGWILPLQVPFWIAVLALVLLYNLVAWPIKAVRHAVYRPGGGYHPTWVGAWDGVAVLALVLVLGWWAYHHLANVHDFLEPLLHSARTTLSV